MCVIICVIILHYEKNTGLCAYEKYIRIYYMSVQ